MPWLKIYISCFSLFVIVNFIDQYGWSILENPKTYVLVLENLIVFLWKLMLLLLNLYVKNHLYYLTTAKESEWTLIL